MYGSGYYVICTSFQVGLVIGKGGETIKNMQARTGARIQVPFKICVLFKLDFLFLFLRVVPI